MIFCYSIGYTLIGNIYLIQYIQILFFATSLKPNFLANTSMNPNVNTIVIGIELFFLNVSLTNPFKFK